MNRSGDHPPDASDFPHTKLTHSNTVCSFESSDRSILDNTCAYKDSVDAVTVDFKSVCDSSSGFRQSFDYNSDIQANVNNEFKLVSNTIKNIQNTDENLIGSIKTPFENNEDDLQGTGIEEYDRKPAVDEFDLNVKNELTKNEFVIDKSPIAEIETSVDPIIEETKNDDKNDSESQLLDKDLSNSDTNDRSQNKTIHKTKEVKQPIKNHALLAINISIAPDESDSAISAYIKQRASRALKSLTAENDVDTDAKEDLTDKKSLPEDENTGVKPSDSISENEESSKTETKPRINPLLTLNINIEPDEHDLPISAYIKQRAARAIKAKMEAQQAKGNKRSSHVNKPFRVVDVRTPVSANVANRMSSKFLKSSDLIDICEDINYRKVNHPVLDILSQMGTTNNEDAPKIINTSGMIMPIDMDKVIDESKQDQKTDSDVTPLETDTDEISKQKSSDEIQNDDEEDYKMYMPSIYPTGMTREQVLRIAKMARMAELAAKNAKDKATNDVNNDPQAEEVESKSVSEKDTSESESESDTTESPKPEVVNSEDPMTSAESAAKTVVFESGSSKEKSLLEKEKGKHGGKHQCIIV